MSCIFEPDYAYFEFRTANGGAPVLSTDTLSAIGDGVHNPATYSTPITADQLTKQDGCYFIAANEFGQDTLYVKMICGVSPKQITFTTYGVISGRISEYYVRLFGGRPRPPKIS